MAASPLLDRLRQFWLTRSRRERTMIAAAAGVVLLGGLYGLIYAPLETRRGKLAERLPDLRAQHRLLNVQMTEIERLRRQSSGASQANASLQRRLEASASAQGLRDALKGITELGKDRVQILSGEKPADVWLRWLFELRSQGIRVEACRITLSEKTGLALLEATLHSGTGK